MTIDDPTSRPSGEEFREVFDLVDRVVSQVPDEHIEQQLMKLLTAEKKLGQSLGVTTWSTLDQPDAKLDMPFPAELRLADAECRIREAEARAAIAEAAAAEAELRAQRQIDQAIFLAKTVAQQEEKARLAAQGTEAFVDTALERSQEILDQAHREASEIIAAAEREAAALAAESPPPVPRARQRGGATPGRSEPAWYVRATITVGPGICEMASIGGLTRSQLEAMEAWEELGQLVIPGLADLPDMPSDHGLDEIYAVGQIMQCKSSRSAITPAVDGSADEVLMHVLRGAVYEPKHVLPDPSKVHRAFYTRLRSRVALLNTGCMSGVWERLFGGQRPEDVQRQLETAGFEVVLDGCVVDGETVDEDADDDEELPQVHQRPKMGVMLVD